MFKEGRGPSGPMKASPHTAQQSSPGRRPWGSHISHGRSGLHLMVPMGTTGPDRKAWPGQLSSSTQGLPSISHPSQCPIPAALHSSCARTLQASCQLQGPFNPSRKKPGRGSTDLRTRPGSHTPPPCSATAGSRNVRSQ